MANILILEDEVTLSAYWQALLESHEHLVVCCTTVTQVLEQISVNDVDLIIADMMIKNQDHDAFEPQGGLTLISKRKFGELSPVPILGVSGYKPSVLSKLSPLQIAKEQGADLILYKPISPETFLNAVNTLLGSTVSPVDPIR